MTEQHNGWAREVLHVSRRPLEAAFREVRYSHDDGSLISWDGTRREKPWALFVWDSGALCVLNPPGFWDWYETPEAAMAAHADGEWREHMRGTP